MALIIIMFFLLAGADAPSFQRGMFQLGTRRLLLLLPQPMVIVIIATVAAQCLGGQFDDPMHP
ncbi:hypothetical protein D3C80_1898390 [compost metagenome]